MEQTIDAKKPQVETKAGLISLSEANSQQTKRVATAITVAYCPITLVGSHCRHGGEDVSRPTVKATVPLLGKQNSHSPVRMREMASAEARRESALTSVLVHLTEYACTWDVMRLIALRSLSGSVRK